MNYLKLAKHFTCLFIVLLSASFVYSQPWECRNYNMFSHDGRADVLKPYTESIYPGGSLIFNPSLGEELGTTDDLFNLLNLQNGITFDILNVQPSRIDDRISYIRYQQYYNGIEVIGGGVVVGKNTGGGDIDPVDPAIVCCLSIPT